MTMKLLAIAMMAAGCGLAITLASCNGDKDGVANAPAQPTRGQGTVHVLSDNCNSTFGIDRCVIDGASIAFDPAEDGLVVSNANDISSGVSTTFEASYYGQFYIHAAVPRSTTDQFMTVAYNQSVEQGRLVMTVNPTNTSQTAIRPTFKAGDGQFKIEIFNDGVQVAVQDGVKDNDNPTVANYPHYYPPGWRWHILGLNPGRTRQAKGQHVDSDPADRDPALAGACVWTVGHGTDEPVTYIVPNGTSVDGDEIRFTEQVDGSGRYPYHSVDRLDVLSNMGTFNILSEQAGN